MTEQKRILIVQLAALGDCLYVTALARQIKHDYPGCHLTWAIGSRCSQVIQNNPYIDAIWEVNIEKMSDASGVAWEEIKKKAIEKQENGFYDNIFFTQICPDNFYNYDGTIRSTIFRGYPKPITVPIAPIIILTENEIKNVDNFVKQHNLKNYKHVILFESSPGSSQSLTNNVFAYKISKKIVEKFEDSIIIITSHLKVNSSHNRIIDASSLTFRENAELSKHCNLLLGCSSGITWLLTSTWAKKIPTIQLLKKRALLYEFASVNYDLKFWGQPTDHIIEITKFEEDYIFDCISMALEAGIERTRRKYNENLKPSFKSILWMSLILVYRKKFKQIIPSWKNFYERNKELFF